MDTGTQSKDTGRTATTQATTEIHKNNGSRADVKDDDAAAAVREKIESATDTVSQYSKRAGEILQDATSSVTEGLKESAEYLRGEGISGVVEDIATIIRRYPLQTLVFGVGIGFLLSRGRRRLL